MRRGARCCTACASGARATPGGGLRRSVIAGALGAAEQQQQQQQRRHCQRLPGASQVGAFVRRTIGASGHKGRLGGDRSGRLCCAACASGAQATPGGGLRGWPPAVPSAPNCRPARWGISDQPGWPAQWGSVFSWPAEALRLAGVGGQAPRVPGHAEQSSCWTAASGPAYLPGPCRAHAALVQLPEPLTALSPCTYMQ